ncbi:MAG: hypothetical protein ABI217_06025 [Chthoniobacterales bacterium]
MKNFGMGLRGSRHSRSDQRNFQNADSYSQCRGFLPSDALNTSHPIEMRVAADDRERVLPGARGDLYRPMIGLGIRNWPMTDFYWCEGMSEWKQLSTLEISKSTLATPAQKAALKAAGLAFDDLTTKAQVSALFASHDDAPATTKQLALLSYLGQAASKNLTKKSAADLIDSIVNQDDGRDKFGDWNDDKLILFPDVFADEIAARKEECLAEYNSFRTELGPATSELPKLS